MPGGQPSRRGFMPEGPGANPSKSCRESWRQGDRSGGGGKAEHGEKGPGCLEFPNRVRRGRCQTSGKQSIASLAVEASPNATSRWGAEDTLWEHENLLGQLKPRHERALPGRRSAGAWPAWMSEKDGKAAHS